MTEYNYLISNNPVPATIFDISTFLYHNAKNMLKNNSGPYLFFPKFCSYEEAKLLSILSDCEDYLDIPRLSVKVTCLIETLPAIFQTECNFSVKR